MTQKKESRVRSEIAKRLRSRGASVHVYHASPYGETGHPDLYLTYRGRAIFLEVKPPGWAPRSKAEKDRHTVQKLWLEREEHVGGAVCAVVHTPEEAEFYLGVVDKALDNVSPKQ